MPKITLPALLSAFFLLGPAALFAAPPRASDDLPVRALLADLAYSPAPEVAVSSPAAVDPDFRAYEKPPCRPSQALLPGRTFAPAVSDERRVRAISDLLARIAVCKPMPYDNDGNVHSKPHDGLPKKPSGYYLEYTLIVPGRPTGAKPEAVVIGGETYMTGPVQSIRGPERLMIGGGREVYYTPDHYETFVYLSIVR